MATAAKLIMFNLDCSDPRQLARFYGQVLSWPVTHSQQEYAMIADGDAAIGFGHVPDHKPPAWPDGDAKRYHLDLAVPNLGEAEAACLTLGASVPDFQPGGERWRVLLDPEGHPFCLCRSDPS
jgi:predicted enzyme related to lactoylglutathione lyase